MGMFTFHFEWDFLHCIGHIWAKQNERKQHIIMPTPTDVFASLDLNIKKHRASPQSRMKAPHHHANPN
jgi:hypothetical protein